jgi:hypothetical protein
MFDPWSAITQEHLQQAAANDGVALHLLGSGQGPFRPRFDARRRDPFWSDALRQLEVYRATQAPRSPMDYLLSLAEPRFLRIHAVWPARSIRGDEAPATTIVLLVDDTHAAASAQLCGH